MSKPADEIRREVSRSYSERVTKPSAGGCCGDVPAQKGTVVALGGYSSEELSALPIEAVVNSFGCGNPVALAGLGAGEVVIDLGSGAGIDLFLAAKKVGPAGRVIGVDMTDDMIAKANENIRAGNFTNVEVRKGVIEELPVESASADWVISNCVINLSPEKPRVFREIARVLKPGGQMLVSDIVAKDLPEELLAIPALRSSCLVGAIGEEEYLAGLRSAGLVEVAVRDRLVYDADQLVGLAVGTGWEVEPSPLVREAARTLEGKVWSAKIYARKPR
jgi:arsenite methyltransferase